MKEKKINYLKDKNFLKRVIYTEERIFDLCDYFFKKVKNSEGSELIFTFSLNSSSQYEQESEEFLLKNSDEKNLKSLEDNIKTFLKAESISNIEVTYRHSYNNRVRLSIENTPYFTNEFTISASDNSWYHSTLSEIDKIFKKNIKCDYLPLIMHSLEISLCIYLIYLVDVRKYGIKDTLTIAVTSFLAGAIIPVFIIKISDFIKKKCYPRVEFNFGVEKGLVDQNRRNLGWITSALIIPFIFTFFDKS